MNLVFLGYKYYLTRLYMHDIAGGQGSRIRGHRKTRGTRADNVSLHSHLKTNSERSLLLLEYGRQRSIT